MSLIVLNNKGIQDDQLDTLLKSVPVNPFISNFSRYVNMTSLYQSIQFNDCILGNKIEAIVPRSGDYLNKMWLHFHIDPVQRVDGTFASYVNSLGTALFEYVEIYLDNILLDRHTGVYLDIMNELTNRAKDSDGVLLMRGTLSSPQSLPLFFSTDQDLYIPLRFFFNKYVDSSLPLISIPNQELKLVVKLRPFADIVHYDGDILPIPGQFNCTLVAQYYFIEKTLRDQIKDKPKKYVIEQVQRIPTTISNKETSFVRVLNFNHPVKCLYWVLYENDSLLNNDYFNYSNRSIEFDGIAQSFKLTIQNEILIDNNHESFYRLLLPSIVHSNVSNKFIYIYPFSSLSAESLESNGTCNFSLLNNVCLHGTIKSDIASDIIHVDIYAVNYNILQIAKGFAKVLYQA